MMAKPKGANSTYALIITGAILLILGVCLLLTSSNVSSGIVIRASSDVIEIQKKDGSTETFVNKVNDITVGHLYEHQLSEEPVKVTWEKENGQKTAVSVEDE